MTFCKLKTHKNRSGWALNQTALREFITLLRPVAAFEEDSLFLSGQAAFCHYQFFSLMACRHYYSFYTSSLYIIRTQRKAGFVQILEKYGKSWNLM